MWIFSYAPHATKLYKMNSAYGSLRSPFRPSPSTAKFLILLFVAGVFKMV
jgi:hypothetical protein